MDQSTLTAVVAIVGSGMGLLGALSGVFLNEFFARRRRVETYAQKIFDRRLEAYERLLSLLNAGNEAFAETLGNTDLSEEQRESLMGDAILNMAEYADANMLYLDEHVAVNACAIFVGAAKIASMDLDRRFAAAKEVRNDYKVAREMIIAESGLRLVNSHFKSVTGSKPDSRLIRVLKEKQEEMKEKRKT